MKAPLNFSIPYTLCIWPNWSIIAHVPMHHVLNLFYLMNFNVSYNDRPNSWYTLYIQTQDSDFFLKCAEIDVTELEFCCSFGSLTSTGSRLKADDRIRLQYIVVVTGRRISSFLTWELSVIYRYIDVYDREKLLYISPYIDLYISHICYLLYVF